MCEGGSSGSRDPSWARGHSVLPALSSVAGGCLDRRWWLPLSPSVSHTPGGQRESPQGHQAGLPVATKRCLGLGDGAVPAEGRGSSLDVAARPGGSLPSLEWRPWGSVPCHSCVRVTPVPCHSCPRASQRCCWGSPRAQPGQRCPSASTGLLPPGMFARWHGHRMGDGEGSDRAALGHGWVFPYPDSGPQSVPAAPGRGDVGLCQRSCPTLPRVGEAELRQEC